MSNPSVYEAIWPWRRGGGKPAAQPPSRPAAVIQAAVMTALAGFLALKYHHRIVPCVLVIIAIILTVTAFFAPAAYAAIRRGEKKVAHGTAVALNWLLLVPFYYLCFVPGHLILLALRRDPMCRRFPSDEKTYWTPRAPVPGVEQYKRQY